jgi:TatD DNase family protein
MQLALTRTDIAVNLTDPMYRGEYHGKTRHASDLDQVVERAKKAGVERILITGTSLQETKDALALAKKYSMSRTC